jgi:hypothetical protein
MHEYGGCIIKLNPSNKIFTMSLGKEFKPQTGESGQNAGRQGVDKDPAEEKGKKEKVTTKDLKGKKVDADPEDEKDQPVDQNE